MYFKTKLKYMIFSMQSGNIHYHTGSVYVCTPISTYSLYMFTHVKCVLIGGISIKIVKLSTHSYGRIMGIKIQFLPISHLLQLSYT